MANRDAIGGAGFPNDFIGRSAGSISIKTGGAIFKAGGGPGLSEGNHRSAMGLAGAVSPAPDEVSVGMGPGTISGAEVLSRSLVSGVPPVAVTERREEFSGRATPRAEGPRRLSTCVVFAAEGRRSWPSVPSLQMSREVSTVRNTSVAVDSNSRDARGPSIRQDNSRASAAAFNRVGEFERA